MVREELITSRGELRDLQVELRAVNGDLNDKETQLEAARREAFEGKVLLETARRESSEAVNLAERLNEECRGLRADLYQRVSLVAQRDEVIRQLRDQASAQWAWVARFSTESCSRVLRSGLQLRPPKRRRGGGIFLYELFSRAWYSC